MNVKKGAAPTVPSDVLKSLERKLAILVSSINDTTNCFRGMPRRSAASINRVDIGCACTGRSNMYITTLGKQRTKIGKLRICHFPDCPCIEVSSGGACGSLVAVSDLLK